MRIDRKTVHFLRWLIAGETGTRTDDLFVLGSGQSCTVKIVARLAQKGALRGDGVTCAANGATRGFLLKQLAAKPRQQRRPELERRTDGSLLNPDESPLARLSRGPGRELAPHQVEAGERLRRLFERAQMRQRVTGRYDGGISGGRGRGPGDVGDTAMDARQKLARLYETMPRESLDIAIEICGHLKGLQDVERSYDLPPRCGRLVLKLALEQLALTWGLTSVAIGPENSKLQTWQDRAAPCKHGPGSVG